MEEAKKKFPWKPVAVLTVCLILIAGLLWFNLNPPIPAYKNALFTADQIAEMLPKTLSTTNTYKKEGFLDDSLFITPQIPQANMINIYQRTYYAEPSEEAVQTLIDDIFPLFEKILGSNIPALTIREYDNHYYDSEYDTNGNLILASSSVHSAHAGIRADHTLKFFAEPIYLNAWQTDEEIIESISAIISYLEQVFDIELSAYKIYRYYHPYDGALASITVCLYSANQEIDSFLKQYSGSPSHYASGEMLSLYFGNINLGLPNDTVACSELDYYRVQQPLYEVSNQCRMLTLGEAEALLKQGCVFSFHNCPICMRNQAQVDFSNYDRVCLEYVFEYKKYGYAVPFYAFYKKIHEEDGFVQYAKTMVPAIEVSGLKEYFQSQKEYHKDSKND